MSEMFLAQTLVETGSSKDGRRLEVTFVNAAGAQHTISIPSTLAADLASVFAELAENSSKPAGPEFTKVPRQWAVGRAQHERLVLLKFDDEPPYGLEVEIAEMLWREMREEAEHVSQLKAPVLQ
jgi:hypothetical protein